MAVGVLTFPAQTGPGGSIYCSSKSMGCRAASLLFDLEIEVNTPTHAPPQPQKTHQASKARQRLAGLASTTTLFQSRLLRDVKCCMLATLREEQDLDIVVLASKLATVGYKLCVRTALGGGPGQLCFQNLRHEFLVARDDEDGSFLTTSLPSEVIVDPRFREQFGIANAPTWYQQVLEAVPEVFLGQAAALKQVVAVLAAEMAAVYQQQGVPVPPWRNSQSLTSKWLPTKRRDAEISRTTLSSTSVSLKAPVVSTAGKAAAVSLTLGNTASPTTTLAEDQLNSKSPSTEQQVRGQGAVQNWPHECQQKSEDATTLALVAAQAGVELPLKPQLQQQLLKAPPVVLPPGLKLSLVKSALRAASPPSVWLALPVPCDQPTIRTVKLKGRR